MTYANKEGNCIKSAYTKSKERELIAKGFVRIDNDVDVPKKTEPVAIAGKAKKGGRPKKAESVNPVGDGVEIEI